MGLLSNSAITKPLVNLSINLDQVFVTITIGNYQIGGSYLFFTDDPNTTVGKGNISQLLIGDRAVIQGRTLKIITTVLDANPSSTAIAVTIGFKGTSSSPL